MVAHVVRYCRAKSVDKPQGGKEEEFDPVFDKETALMFLQLVEKLLRPHPIKPVGYITPAKANVSKTHSMLRKSLTDLTFSYYWILQEDMKASR